MHTLIIKQGGFGKCDFPNMTWPLIFGTIINSFMFFMWETFFEKKKILGNSIQIILANQNRSGSWETKSEPLKTQLTSGLEEWGRSIVRAALKRT